MFIALLVGGGGGGGKEMETNLWSCRQHLEVLGKGWGGGGRGGCMCILK